MALTDVGARFVVQGESQFLNSMARGDDAMNRMGATTVATGTLIADGFKRILSSAQSAIGGVIDFSSQLQQADVAFRVFLGSADAAKATMTDLAQFTKATPFEFPQVLQAAQNLLAYGTTAKDIIPTLTMLGNLSRGNAQVLGQLQLAYGQVQAATKLTGAELRQFTEAGIPLLQGLADKFGVTTAAAQKMISDGKVGFTDVRDVLAKMVNEGGKFHNLMAEQSKTFAGAMSNIKDSLNFAAAEGFAPFFAQLTTAAVAVGAFLETQQFKDFATQVGTTMAMASEAVGTVVTVLFNLGDIVAHNTPLLEGMAAVAAYMLAPAIFSATKAFAMMAAPIVGVGLVLGAVAAAIAVVIDHWSLFEQAGGIVMTVMGKIADTVGSVVGPALEWLGKQFQTLTDFMTRRFVTIAQGMAILGHAVGADVTGLVGFIAKMEAGTTFDGLKQNFSTAVDVVTGQIAVLKSNAEAGLTSLSALFDAVIARITRPINFGGGTVPGLPDVSFSGNPPPVSGDGEGGAAKVKKAKASIKADSKEIDDALRLIQQRAEGLGESIRKALGTDIGSVLDRVKQGLADFAKAEWIADLSARITVVSAQVQKAIAEGLDPTSIIEGAKELFAAYASAVDDTAKRIAEATAQRVTEADAELDQRIRVADEVKRIDDVMTQQRIDNQKKVQDTIEATARLERDTILATARLQEKASQEEYERKQQRRAEEQRMVDAMAAFAATGLGKSVGESAIPALLAIGEHFNVNIGSLLDRLGKNAYAIGIDPNSIHVPTEAEKFGASLAQTAMLPPSAGAGNAGGAPAMTFNVTANYSSPQEPQSILMDLQSIAMRVA